MAEEQYEISSEIYKEFDYKSNLKPIFNENYVVSKFLFSLPKFEVDPDGDLLITRKSNKSDSIEIEHSTSTTLNQVGLQIWRGSLLLADWLIYKEKELPEGTILELGAGVGITSIIASLYRPVVATDVNIGNLLELIKHNIKRNKDIVKNKIKVLELDFYAQEFNKEIESELPRVQVVIAADIVYDDRLTEAFTKTIQMLIWKIPKVTIYIALEKRYVFTLAELDAGAPCFEHFLDCMEKLKEVQMIQIPVDFPQYFNYQRIKELVLLKITSK